MPQASEARLVLKQGGEITVTRDQILQAIEEFDQRGWGERARDNRQGWSIEKDGKRYDPKWILRLATGVNLPKIRLIEARKTLSALGFELVFESEWRDRRNAPPSGDDDGDGQQAEEDAIELTFGIEDDLQRALRGNIEQLETGLKITDGGKEKTVATGRIDITAEDRNGVAVVIELKTGEASHHAIGQILSYMGDLAGDKKYGPGADQSAAMVRGILVAKDFSARAIAAARVVPGLQLRKYNFKFAFETVGAG